VPSNEQGHLGESEPSEVQPLNYLTAGEVRRFNQEILRRAGQSSAFLREEGLLESAVQRPQNAAYYAEADLLTQAALYMVGIALNHPFVDGNKRTGYVSGMTFLRLNGVTSADVRLNDAEVGAWLEQLVSRQLDFQTFIERLHQRIGSW
jgi:death-on-curing family protein